MIPNHWQPRSMRGISGFARPTLTAKLSYKDISQLRKIFAKFELGEGDLIEVNERDFDLLALDYRRQTGEGIAQPFFLDGVEIRYSQQYRLPQHTVAIEQDKSDDGKKGKFIPVRDFPSATELTYRPGHFERL